MSTDSRTQRDDDLLQRIRGEFMEMPGLRLTTQQAQRLWALDDATCRRALTRLVESGFLRCTEGDYFVRRTEGTLTAAPLQMAKASSRSETFPHRTVS